MELVKKTWAKTIWAKGAVPESEGELASDVKRGLLPIFDLVLIFTAILAIRGGMPTFEIVYSSSVSTIAAWGLLMAASLGLVGVSFPKLWLLEAVSKIGLFAVLFGYALVLLLYSAEDAPRGFVGGIMLAVSSIPVWRVIWMGREYRRRGKK